MPTELDAEPREYRRSHSQSRHERGRDWEREGRREDSGRARDDRRESPYKRERDDRSTGGARVDSSRGQPDSLPPLGRLKRPEHGGHHRSSSLGASDRSQRERDQFDPRRMQSPPAKSGEGGPRRYAGSSPLVAELARMGKSLAETRRAGSESGVEEDRLGGNYSDAEAGEIQASEDYDEHEAGGSGRKRKHAPIVWQPERPERPSKSGRPPSILDRAMEEAEMLKQMQMEEPGVDPDAPAAMKASPSFSGEGSPTPSGSLQAAEGPGVVAEHEGGEAGVEVDPEVESPEIKPGKASRWLDMEDGGDVPGSASKAAVSQRGTEGGPTVSLGVDPELSSSSDDGGDSDDDMSERTVLNRTYDMMMECRSVDLFEKISRISEGTYGVVYKAREKKTGKLVALKRIKMEKEREGFPITSIREINILLNFNHKNIVNVNEVVMSPKNPDHIFMVMELMDHDLKSLMEDKSQMARPFSVAEVKCLMHQLLEGMMYLHNNWVIHRDLKTSNILYNSKGELKICDFGMARQYGSPLRTYSHFVITLHYRPPELLLGGVKHYSTGVDVWSLGCIMGELLQGETLFPGRSEMDQLDKIFNLMGSPNEANWPGMKKMPNFNKIVIKPKPSELRNKFQASYGGGAILSENGFDLLSSLLHFDPDLRISCENALNHPWFSEAPLPTKKELMPMFNPRKDADAGYGGKAQANMFSKK